MHDSSNPITRLTATALDKMGVPYHMVVEEQELEMYAKHVSRDALLVLPQKYLDEYDTCDDRGQAFGKGSGAARNFVWDHSISNGATWHWILDDNIDGFMRLNRNMKVTVLTGAIFRCAEDFVERYENVALAGFNYVMFAKRKDSSPPFVLNTRVYSCILIRNDIPFRWRARYNEDVDLSLRVLKAGYCTIQFNAFLANKVRTMSLKGGNRPLYEADGTLMRSEMLTRLHPDVSHVLWKFGRWHHHVNYNPFKKNKLKKKKGLHIPKGVDNYGMILKPTLERAPKDRSDAACN